MTLSVKYLCTNESNHNDDEVPEGTPFGFWRIVEHMGGGWFPWPSLYTSREAAEKALPRHDV